MTVEVRATLSERARNWVLVAVIQNELPKILEETLAVPASSVIIDSVFLAPRRSGEVQAPHSSRVDVGLVITITPRNGEEWSPEYVGRARYHIADQLEKRIPLDLSFSVWVRVVSGAYVERRR